MKVLVTGGAGFIGRWVVKGLVSKGIDVFVIDNLDNGREINLEEFMDNPHLKKVVYDSILNREVLNSIFQEKLDICIHLAAQINVQESLDNPSKSFENNVLGTYYILEEALKNKTKVVLMGTCMVYDLADSVKPIGESHPVRPASPYAGSKVAAEDLAISYHYGLGLPVIVLRPFNTYGPFQKTNMEGGVVSIFCKRALAKEPLNIFGDGKQTRDLLYVEDCADFVIKAALSDKGIGQVFNAGTGEDISINNLAAKIEPDSTQIKHIPHHHPQSEIMKLVCDYSKAKRVFGWTPQTTLQEGVAKLKDWMKQNPDIA